MFKIIKDFFYFPYSNRTTGALCRQLIHENFYRRHQLGGWNHQNSGAQGEVSGDICSQTVRVIRSCLRIV